jgi:hypothetical protein
MLHYQRWALAVPLHGVGGAWKMWRTEPTSSQAFSLCPPWMWAQGCLSYNPENSHGSTFTHRTAGRRPLTWHSWCDPTFCRVSGVGVGLTWAAVSFGWVGEFRVFHSPVYLLYFWNIFTLRLNFFKKNNHQTGGKKRHEEYSVKAKLTVGQVQF